jgi:hypothetical protein
LIATKTSGSSIKFLLGTVKDIPLEILFELHRVATDFHFAARMLKEISRKQSKPPKIQQLAVFQSEFQVGTGVGLDSEKIRSHHVKGGRGHRKMRSDAVLSFTVAWIAICGVADAQGTAPSSQQSQSTPVAPSKSPKLNDVISEEKLQPTAEEIAIDRKLNICYHCFEAARPIREPFDHCLKRRDARRHQPECS